MPFALTIYCFFYLKTVKKKFSEQFIQQEGSNEYNFPYRLLVPSMAPFV